MESKKQNDYLKPQIEVINVENEGVMAASIGDMPYDTWGTIGATNPMSNI